MNNSTRQAVTAALMAGFFMVANGLALAWTLTSDGAHMRRGFVIVMIAISTALLPAMMWGLFRLPRLAVQVVIAATTFLVAAAIYGSGDSQAPLAFLFLWAIPYTMAFFNARQALVQIAPAIVSPIAEMARALGARVVAEGVETEEQLHGVRKLGCELAQGYLFARPLPSDEIDGLLRTDPWRVVTISR